MVWWLWLVVGGLLGMLVGGVAVFALVRGRGSAAEVRRLQSELSRYREDVSEHFVRTAELVNTLTHDYRKVYEHLETGAYDLVGEGELRRRLGGVDADPVLLEYIGNRTPDPQEPDRADAEPSDARRPGLGRGDVPSRDAHDAES